MLSRDLLRNFAESLLHKEIAAAALLGRRTRIKIGIRNTSWRRLHRPAIPAEDSRPLIAETGGWKIFVQGASLPLQLIETPQLRGTFLWLQSIAQLIEQQEHIGLAQP